MSACTTGVAAMGTIARGAFGFLWCTGLRCDGSGSGGGKLGESSISVTSIVLPPAWPCGVLMMIGVGGDIKKSANSTCSTNVSKAAAQRCARPLRSKAWLTAPRGVMLVPLAIVGSVKWRILSVLLKCATKQGEEVSAERLSGHPNGRRSCRTLRIPTG